MSAAALTWRYFVTHPEERPRTAVEQAALASVLGVTLALDLFLVLMLIRKPLHSTVVYSVAALLWFAAGRLRA